MTEPEKSGRRRPNRSQRIVAVVALGAALWIVAGWISDRLLDSSGMWLNYAPGAGSALFNPPGGGYVNGSVGVWLGAVILWAAISMFLLRDEQR